MTYSLPVRFTFAKQPSYFYVVCVGIYIYKLN